MKRAIVDTPSVCALNFDRHTSLGCNDNYLGPTLVVSRPQAEEYRERMANLVKVSVVVDLFLLVFVLPFYSGIACDLKAR